MASAASGGAWKLLGTSLPYVSTLREIGVHDDLVYVIHDEHPWSLKDKILRDRGLTPASVLCLARQMLEGLAALHTAKLTHGDVRAANVFLSNAPGQGEVSGQVWIAEPAIGGVYFWSGGKFRSRSSARYAPPEWGDRPQEPSYRADLYALGILLCEALIGVGKVGDALARAQKTSTSLWSQVVRDLPALRHGWVRQLHARRALRFVLKRLLSPEAVDRPEDAGHTLRKLNALDGAGRRRLVGALGGGVAAVTLFAPWLVWRLHDNSVRIASLQTENEKLKGRVAILEVKNNSPTPPTPVSPMGPGSEEWIEEVSKNPDLDGRAERAEQLYERLLADRKQAEAANHVRAWREGYVNLYLEAKPWLPAQSKRMSGQRFRQTMTTLLDQVWREPWKEEHHRLAEQHLDRLNKAAKCWQGWASDSELRFEKLADQIHGQPAEIREILEAWKADLAATKEWTLRLQSASAPAGHGTTRVVTVNGITSPVHQWQSDTVHDYTRDLANRDITFNWEPDMPIQIILEDDWSIWRFGVRKNRIDDSLTAGPLAIWRLHSRGASINDGFSLKYEVLDCPGPPRDWSSEPPSIAPILNGDPAQ